MPIIVVYKANFFIAHAHVQSSGDGSCQSKIDLVSAVILLKKKRYCFMIWHSHLPSLFRQPVKSPASTQSTTPLISANYLYQESYIQAIFPQCSGQSESINQ